MSPSLFSAPRDSLERPIMFGPQYPFMFRSTTFEPDTGFTLEEGKTFIQMGNSAMNTFVMSSNSAKNDTPSGSAATFNNTSSKGYSVYFDGEIDRQFIRLFYGYSDFLELQYTYRQFRFIAGELDETIENFHGTFGLENQGREKTDRDQLEVYIHDNETNQNVFVLTEQENRYRKESVTLGLKFSIKETSDEALSFTLVSNTNDYFIERGINQSSVEDTREHRNFNDMLGSINYSSLFSGGSLFGAFAIAHVSKSLLENSPTEIYYYFLGSNWHLSENWDLQLQSLNYSSPFPKDGVSTIGADVREIALGLRWFWGDDFNLETGLIENQSQGPQNIDIVFYSTINFVL